MFYFHASCYWSLYGIDFYITCTAIATVVTIAEILKNNGLAVEKSEISIQLFISFDCFLLSSLC